MKKDIKISKQIYLQNPWEKEFEIGNKIGFKTSCCSELEIGTVDKKSSCFGDQIDEIIIKVKDNLKTFSIQQKNIEFFKLKSKIK